MASTVVVVVAGDGGYVYMDVVALAAATTRMEWGRIQSIFL
jgi:hypothetical protein